MNSKNQLTNKSILVRISQDHYQEPVISHLSKSAQRNQTM